MIQVAIASMRQTTENLEVYFAFPGPVAPEVFPPPPPEYFIPISHLKSEKVLISSCVGDSVLGQKID